MSGFWSILEMLQGGFRALSGDTRYLEYILIMKEKGGSAVCDLLDEMVNRGIKLGKQEGIEEGIQQELQKDLISTCRELKLSFEDTAAKVKEKYCLGDEETGNSMKLYW